MSDLARIAALETEVAHLRSENARLRAARDKPVVVLRVVRRGIGPWLAVVLIGLGSWIAYAISS